jgi:uncharacterized delta-60 repeat protein
LLHRKVSATKGRRLEMKRRGDWKRWSAVAALVAGLLVSSAAASASFGHHGKRVISHLGLVWDALPYGKSKTLLVSGPGAESKITRLRANGSVDRAFGDNGHVDIPLQRVAAQPDGGILVLVTSKREDGEGSDPVLTRLLPDGAIDRSFGRAGSLAVDLGDRYDEGAAMTVLPDGKIVIAGRSGASFEPRAGVIRGDVVAARLSHRGRLDHSFGDDGRVVVPPAEEPTALKPGPGGTVYLQDGGSFRRLIRLTRNGAVDASYGQEGTVTIPFQVEPPETFFLPQGEFAVLPDGGVMIAASLSTSGDQQHGKVAVLRLRPDGSVSGAYGDGGLARVGVPGGWVAAAGVAATGEGRAVVVGSSQVPLGSRSRMTALVLTPAGKLDRRFGRGGRMRIGSGGWVTGDDLLLRHGKALLVGDVRGAKTLLAQVPLVRRR